MFELMGKRNNTRRRWVGKTCHTDPTAAIYSLREMFIQHQRLKKRFTEEEDISSRNTEVVQI